MTTSIRLQREAYEAVEEAASAAIKHQLSCEFCRDRRRCLEGERLEREADIAFDVHGEDAKAYEELLD